MLWSDGLCVPPVRLLVTARLLGLAVARVWPPREGKLRVGMNEAAQLRGCLARRAAGETTAELFGDQACQQAYLRHQTGADEAAEISWTNIDDINRRSGGAVDFFHEPERMAEAGRAFVGRAVDAGVPFFLHLNPTLLHLPLGGRMMERLTNQSLSPIHI